MTLAANQLVELYRLAARGLTDCLYVVFVIFPHCNCIALALRKFIPEAFVLRASRVYFFCPTFRKEESPNLFVLKLILWLAILVVFKVVPQPTLYTRPENDLFATARYHTACATMQSVLDWIFEQCRRIGLFFLDISRGTNRACRALGLFLYD